LAHGFRVLSPQLLGAYGGTAVHHEEKARLKRSVHLIAVGERERERERESK
jgi:hypothetical protein